MISVLGCGWLGMPLARHLISLSYSVKGSTTKISKLNELTAQGIDPYLVHLSSDQMPDKISEFLNSEVLIINIPPGRNSEEAPLYVKKMQMLNKHIKESTIKKVIFISSTSVYKETNDIVNEDDLIDDSESAQRLYQAEEVFKSNLNIQTTVIRMSGLIGPQRHPGRFFAEKIYIPNGLIPVNLIHLDDCIGIITYVIENDIWGEVINGAAPSHPTKMEFYQKATQLLSGKTAEFIAEKKAFKIISSDKLITDLNYQFKHPDLMACLEERSNF